VLAFLRILPHYHEALARCARKARPAPPEALAVRGSLRRLPALLTLPLSRFLPTSYGTPYRRSYCILALTPSP